MKRERIHLSQHQVIETYRDWSGRVYIAYSGGASVFIRDRKDLVRFLKIPKSIPMRSSLDSWLDSLAAADATKKGAEAPVPHVLVEGSFDPGAHDVDNENTRTVI